MARLIDADALKKRFKFLFDFGKCRFFKLVEIDDVIDGQPTVELRNKEAILRGRWEEFEFEFGGTHDIGYRCSECHSPQYQTYKYCPECGTKMEAKG